MDIFSFLYELFWSPKNPAFRNEIFPLVGIISTLTVLLLPLAFYVMWGRFRAEGTKTKHWSLWLLTLIILDGIILLYTSMSVVDFNPFILYFLLINTIYILIFYMIFSAILKKFSIFAKNTPSFLP